MSIAASMNQRAPTFLSSQQDAPPVQQMFPAWSTPQPDPWATPGADPWASASSSWAAPASAPPAAPYYDETAQATFLAATFDDADCSDTDTSLDDLTEPVADPGLSALPANQQGEAIYWAYKQAKKQWRRFSHKPPRKVRTFHKRAKGKGKGFSGPSNQSPAYPAYPSYPAWPTMDIFFKGKGGKGGSGNGSGPRTNPREKMAK
jgi:hypothetical protein